MKERQYLKKSILLCGESDEGTFKRTFTIGKVINRDNGASSVCYEAYYEKSSRGVLKEFYPVDAYALERNEQGQLISPAEFGDAQERFRKAEKEYLEPYEMLIDAKQNSGSSDLATFIPAFEIYHGCDTDGKIIGTSYIWTPDPELETFDKICDQIHKHPGIQPEKNLVTVLCAVKSLTECICALHCADMVHRDIKPSNFGFVKRRDETLTQSISMFDVNSICSVYKASDNCMGTEGYMEPEAGYENASNQTDIYSIGAALFHAVIVSGEAKDNHYLYQSSQYHRLKELVDTSKLIQASEANSHPRLRHILTNILQKCLCERTYRYANCEELLKDLEDALYYALPSDIACRKPSGEQWILADVEKSLDVNKEKNSSLAIQYHLYEQPLYQYLPADAADINVLIAGFGNYGQKFLDACLQAGQMRGKTLNITVISDDGTDREIYLQERPELDQFFNIDGSLEGSKDTYGNITFRVTDLKRHESKSNTDALQNLMYDCYDTGYPHYVFIALGEDSLNASAANACREAADTLEAECSIHYICENEQNAAQPHPGTCPLYVNADMKKTASYQEVERMAFNTHLIWEKNLNVDDKSIRNTFRKKYNHDACVASVLSLKYKLYSIGIDLQECSFEKAAREFTDRELHTNKKNNQMKNELIWIEHRRWVTEKLCLGWKRKKNLTDCLDGSTKDEKRKQHICIVRSMPNQKLAAEYTVNGSYDKWDHASKAELSQLDDLDRLSVKLHQLYVQKAEEVKKQNLLSGHSIAEMKTLIGKNKKCIASFQEWYSCLKDIWNGDKEKVPLYEGLKYAFLNSVKNLSSERKKSVTEQVKAFEAMFYPVLASMEYRDWKQLDTDIIRNIPFVLTYTQDAYMVIPYDVEDNTRTFGNAAAASVVSPKKILYLCLIEDRSNISDLKKSLPHIIEYMSKKRMKAAVEIIIFYTGSAAAFVNEKLETEIKKLGNGRITYVRSMSLTKTEALSDDLTNYLMKRSKGKRVFAVEKNFSGMSRILQGAGFYNFFAHYRYDSAKMKFEELSGCDMFGYITKSAFMTVADMTAFHLSISENNSQPEFFQDYKELWKRYCKNKAVWKQLCDTLGNYSKTNDVIACFKQKTAGYTSIAAYRYILPFVCSKSAEKIIALLKEHDIIEQESSIHGYTTDSCEIIIMDKHNPKCTYDQLFSNVYALMVPDAVNIYLNEKRGEANVVFDNLSVTDVQMPAGRADALKELLDYFSSKGYIMNFTASANGKMSFTYATRQIKGLMTTAGKMLEVYTYHKVKENGRFDDIVSGYEINWEQKDVINELDCIITKGFRSLFVECKARRDLEQDFYYKLAELTKKFGINAIPVLIADAQETHENEIQKMRGEMMDVVTIWNRDEINDIGNTLMKVINGTYQNMEE